MIEERFGLCRVVTIRYLHHQIPGFDFVKRTTLPLGRILDEGQTIATEALAVAPGMDAAGAAARTKP